MRYRLATLVALCLIVFAAPAASAEIPPAAPAAAGPVCNAAPAALPVQVLVDSLEAEEVEPKPLCWLTNRDICNCRDDSVELRLA